MQSSSSDDVKIAKIVADDLDFEHITVSLTHDDFDDFYESGQWDGLHDAAGFIDALLYLHETVALNKVRGEKLVPNDAVLVRGHLPPNLDPKLPDGLCSDQIINVDDYMDAMWATTVIGGISIL